MRAARIILGIIGVTLVLAFGLPVARVAQEQVSLRSLAPTEANANDVAAATAGTGANIAWERLAAINPDVVGWLTIDSAGVSQPVVQASDAEPERYLTKSLWGRQSLAGCPFVDHRTSLASPHAIVYGHHLTGIGGSFSPLFQCYRQSEFDSLLSSGLTLYAPSHEAVTYRPVCAMRCLDTFQDIQTFDFADEKGLRDWLEALCQDASARTDDWELVARNCSHVLTLVTCSSLTAGQPYRTLVVFGA